MLYAVAAAVIGGTSLFGGRGKMLHAVKIGGPGDRDDLQRHGADRPKRVVQLMVTALVLLAAASVDALARRSSTTEPQLVGPAGPRPGLGSGAHPDALGPLQLLAFGL